MNTADEETRALAKAIGKVVRRRRNASKYTLRGFAKAAGTHAPIVVRTENGRFCPSLDTMVRFARTLGCSVGELVNEAEGKVKPVQRCIELEVE